MVSIPSSSGHQFTVFCSQAIGLGAGRVSIPSSSGHQFTAFVLSRVTPRASDVSIPSSSGHQFTASARTVRGPGASLCFNPFFIRASVYWMAMSSWESTSHAKFQSLLHQGISLLPDGVGSRRGRFQRRFNPFFIRASVYWQRPRCRSTPVPTPFQSLLHQGISLLQAAIALTGRCSWKVSIPSSSGHQFTEGAWRPARRRWRRPFQSLLHQGISLLPCCRASSIRRTRAVSIPSSSGHQFTGWQLHQTAIKPALEFQSLLHQGISLLGVDFFGTAPQISMVSIPSSSGHQFTALWLRAEKF